MITRYFDLSKTEKLSLTDETYLRAVKLEAVNRGIKPPITLDEALRACEFVGYQINPEATKVYEIIRPNEYSSPTPTGLCYLSIERAREALIGAVSHEETGYGASKKSRLVEGDFSVQERLISLNQIKLSKSRIEPYFQDDKEFDAVAEECRADLSKVRQAEYDKALDARKRQEYLNLAGGNEDIAKAFWAKTECRDWPADL